MPTVVREFARAGAGEVGAFTAGVFKTGEVLTAVQNGSGNLELIVWIPDAVNRALTRSTDSGSQAGEVGEIALAMMGRRCLTAVQNADGYLLLIPWALETDGTISRLENVDHQAGTASYLTIAALTDTLAVTAVRSGAGNLLLIPWSIDSATGQVSRLNHDSAQGGYVASWNMAHSPDTPQLEGPLVAAAAIDSSNVITAKSNGVGIEIRAWAIDSNFKVLPWAQFTIDGLIDYVNIAPLGNPGQVRDFVLSYRASTVNYTSGQAITFSRMLSVTVLRVSEADGSISQVTETSAPDLACAGLAVGSIDPNGRTLALVSARSGATQFGTNALVHIAFQLISDSMGRQALIRTGDVFDFAYNYIFATAPVSLEPGRFATAIGHDSGIGVVAFEVSDLSATLVRPLAEATAGAASALRLRAVTFDQAIAGLRNGSDNLELIGWTLAAREFAVSRTADTSSNPIEAQDVALVVFGQRAVTAIQSGSGRLRLDSWDLAADLSSITWLHETGTAAGNADLITATTLDPDLVVTAVRNASGNLLLIVWRLEPDGTLSRLNHDNAQAGEVDELDLVTLDASNVVTAVRNGSGHLQLIGWHIDTNGGVTRWTTDGNAGDISEVKLATLQGNSSNLNVVTAVRDGSNRLLLIVWRVALDERTITRVTDSGYLTSDGSNISLCVVASPPSGRPTLVTAMRRSSNNLRLICWQLLDDPSGIPMLVLTGDMTNRADSDVSMTTCCALEQGRLAVVANLNGNFWLSTFQVRDAVAVAAPANILQLSFTNSDLKDPTDTTWAKSDGSYPSDQAFEWRQVDAAWQEYDDITLAGASGWVVAPEDSGADVPFSHPFGFDWEFSIALDTPLEGLLSPANAGAEEGGDDPNHNGIALADAIGLPTPVGLLGMEWDKGLLPASFRGQVNHGDRVAVVGRWILDTGHDVDGFYRTEIHPPLLLASGTVVPQSTASQMRSRVIFMSRPYLAGQTFTDSVDTRYVDGVDDDGELKSHAVHQIAQVLGFRSLMVECYPKIKSKPFQGSHQIKLLVQPPQTRPSASAQLAVSYRFTTRPPCNVLVEKAPDDPDSILVTCQFIDRDANGVEYQAPRLPSANQLVYSPDQLDLLSPGSGDQIGFVDHLIEGVSLLAGGIAYEEYVRRILNRGIKTDVFNPLPEVDVLDPAGGVHDVLSQQLVPEQGIVIDDVQPYPISGWIEVYWQDPTRPAGM